MDGPIRQSQVGDKSENADSGKTGQDSPTEQASAGPILSSQINHHSDQIDRRRKCTAETKVG